MNKKGFTLVELLGVVVILAIIIGIASAGAITISNRSRQKMYESKVEMILKAAILYYQDKKNELNKETVKVSDLLGQGYLKKDDSDGNALNPLDGSSLNKCEIKVTKHSNRYYAEQFNNTDCNWNKWGIITSDNNTQSTNSQTQSENTPTADPTPTVNTLTTSTTSVGHSTTAYYTYTISEKGFEETKFIVKYTDSTNWTGTKYVTTTGKITSSTIAGFKKTITTNNTTSTTLTTTSSSEFVPKQPYNYNLSSITFWMGENTATPVRTTYQYTTNKINSSFNRKTTFDILPNTITKSSIFITKAGIGNSTSRHEETTKKYKISVINKSKVINPNNGLADRVTISTRYYAEQ